jgi:hypothetical protein
MPAQEFQAGFACRQDELEGWLGDLSSNRLPGQRARGQAVAAADDVAEVFERDDSKLGLPTDADTDVPEGEGQLKPWHQ